MILGGIGEQVDLYHLNTFKVKAKALAFLQIDSVQQLHSYRNEIKGYEKRFILGGGSNLLFVGDYTGLVIYPQLKGMKIIAENDHNITLAVAASENWHAFVVFCLRQGYFGIENLALIPGTVGATPVQNIGAYGVEIGSFVASVECFDLQSGQLIQLSQRECQFAYRDSFIKRAGQGRYLVTQVNFVLHKKPQAQLSYQPLHDFFKGKEKITAKQIFDKICQIRSEKLPDPEQLANAGSFFKNPVIDQSSYQTLLQGFPRLVAYPLIDGNQLTYKIAAGWLIEKAGFKGMTVNKIGVHKHQALVLVNYSDTNGNNILQLAEQIMAGVKAMFGISLEPEVLILGEPKAQEPCQ